MRKLKNPKKCIFELLRRKYPLKFGLKPSYLIHTVLVEFQDHLYESKSESPPTGGFLVFVSFLNYYQKRI